MEKIMTPAEAGASLFADTLDRFCGSEEIYRHWSRRLYWTEGVQYVAENGGAHWLIDAVASWQTQRAVVREPFQSWRLAKAKTGQSWLLTCDDGNGRIVARQRIAYSDFPLSELKLFLEGSPGERVLLPARALAW